MDVGFKCSTDGLLLYFYGRVHWQLIKLNLLTDYQKKKVNDIGIIFGFVITGCIINHNYCPHFTHGKG